MAKSVSAESVELTATDVPTFFAAIDKACARVGCDRTDALYRGHSSTSWMLLPSLLRPAHRGERLGEVESDLFFEFQAQARALHDAPQSDWDTLFAMQHHGVPTRLLDWSEMLGVAIYFALRGASSTTTPCVWVLNPYRLNEETDGSGADYYAPRNLGWDEETFTYYDSGELLVESEPIDWELPIAVYPAQRNARMIAQRGFFTIHGSRPDPIEKLVPRAVHRVSLLPSAVDRCGGLSTTLVSTRRLSGQTSTGWPGISRSGMGSFPFRGARRRRRDQHGRGARWPRSVGLVDSCAVEIHERYESEGDSSWGYASMPLLGASPRPSTAAMHPHIERLHFVFAAPSHAPTTPLTSLTRDCSPYRLGDSARTGPPVSFVSGFDVLACTTRLRSDPQSHRLRG